MAASIISSYAFAPSSENIAFLYRMRERDTITDKLRAENLSTSMEFLDNMDIEISVAIEGETPAEAVKNLNKIFDDYEKLPSDHIFKIANMSGLKNLLSEALKSLAPGEISDTSAENIIEKFKEAKAKKANQGPVMRDMATFAFQKACEDYFGEYFERRSKDKEKFDTLASTRKVYCPSGSIHTWDKNLQWLLDRFKSGATFVIMSEVNKENRIQSNGGTASGFFREVATCYALGYRFEKSGNDIVMKHPNPDSLKTIDIDSIRYNKSQMEAYYDLSIKEFLELKATKTMAPEPKARVMPSASQSGGPLLFQATMVSRKSASNSSAIVKVISEGMRVERADGLREKLTESGIPSYLVVRSNTKGVTNSYQITVETDEAKYIQKTKEVMAAMGITETADIIRVDEDDSTPSPKF